jgi:hypothetical protein
MYAVTVPTTVIVGMTMVRVGSHVWDRKPHAAWFGLTLAGIIPITPGLPRSNRFAG